MARPSWTILFSMAIRGGFGKLVFVIRKSFEKDFREKIISKYENHIPVEVVFQDLNDLPEGFTCRRDVRNRGEPTMPY